MNTPSPPPTPSDITRTRAVRRPSTPAARDPIDTATFALRAALMAKDLREARV